ncbi:MAG: TraB/GumN family protein, partial [Fluviicola sp.]
MKHLKTIIAVSLFTFLISNSQAQEMLKLENSILWKIEHPELKEPSYLLGTLHLLCEEDFVISEKIYTVLDNIDALVLEVNMSDPEELKSLQASMASSKKISEELTESQFKELDELVQKVLK